jgi:hypothetical protein
MTFDAATFLARCTTRVLYRYLDDIKGWGDPYPIDGDVNMKVTKAQVMAELKTRKDK